MLNPRSTGFLNDTEMSFQSGRIKPTELINIVHDCGVDQDKIAKFIKLTKHMPTPILNEMAQRLYDIEATENSRQPMRTDNLPRAFARNQFERSLGNDKQKFIDEVKAMIKSDSASITLPLNYDHLKEIMPTFKNLTTCVLTVAANEIESLQQQLEQINKTIKTDKPDGEELAKLMKKQAELVKEIETVPKKAMHDLIVFNMIKPYISSQIKEDVSMLKAMLHKKIALDNTVTAQLFEGYNKLMAPSVKPEIEKKPKPTAEGPAGLEVPRSTKQTLKR